MVKTNRRVKYLCQFSFKKAIVHRHTNTHTHTDRQMALSGRWGAEVTGEGRSQVEMIDSPA